MGNREDRYKTDKKFKRLFYQKIDEFYQCQVLEDMEYGVEFLMNMTKQIDGKEVFQPLSSFFIEELEYFLYGLHNWWRIKNLLIDEGKIKQVDLIERLELDRQKAEFFFYTIAKMGVLSKEKQGRYNVLSYRTDRITPEKMKKSWSLFDIKKRSTNI